MLKKDKKNKDKSRAAGDLDRQRTERPPRKYFRCGSGDNLIAKCLKPFKDYKKQRKLSVSTKGLIVHRKKNPRTVMTINIKIYMHLWHECMIMKKF